MQDARKMITQNHIRGERDRTQHMQSQKGEKRYTKAKPNHRKEKGDRIQYMPDTEGRERLNMELQNDRSTGKENEPGTGQPQREKGDGTWYRPNAGGRKELEPSTDQLKEGERRQITVQVNGNGVQYCKLEDSNLHKYSLMKFSTSA
jgi:hypothetical protein